MNPHNSDTGFTLLEVMVSLGIISIALVTLLGTHLLSLDLAQKNKGQTLVALLARQKMEEAVATPFDSLADDSGDFGDDYPNYTWELQVENADIENLKKLKIIILDREGKFELETLVARDTIE